MATTVSLPSGVITPAVRSRSWVYSAMTAAVLLTVLIGFAPSLYLRAFFETREMFPRLWVHGIFLTAWFVALWVQATLVASGNVAIHRRLGWLVAAIGVGAVATGVYVALVRMEADTLAARTAWSNLTSAVAFAVFLSAAIALRRNSDAHKRLLLLASISFVQPAIARLFFLSGVGVNPLSGALVVSLLFLLPLAAHDFVTRGKLHSTTLIGGGCLVAAKLIAVFVIAASGWGQAVLARLV